MYFFFSYLITFQAMFMELPLAVSSDQNKLLLFSHDDILKPTGGDIIPSKISRDSQGSYWWRNM